MDKLNARIAHIPLPRHFVGRPLSPTGFPVPWFVSMRDGVPDFVNIHPEKVVEAINRKVCWLCGERLGRYLAFTIGPMCAVNRISAEPPTHLDCARYAVLACPFLVNPRARRNDAAKVPEGGNRFGTMIEDNPGMTAIWITHDYRLGIDREKGGAGFHLGAPLAVEFWKEGRPATRAEVAAKMEERIPILREVARSEGAEAMSALDLQYRKALELLPAA
jgi:hypothetical protein